MSVLVLALPALGLGALAWFGSQLGRLGRPRPRTHPRGRASWSGRAPRRAPVREARARACSRTSSGCADGACRRGAATPAPRHTGRPRQADWVARWAAPMMPALFSSVAGTIGVRRFEQRQELLGVLGDPAADDEEVGPEQRLEVAVVALQPGSAHSSYDRSSASSRALTRRPGLGVVAVDLEVAELGVGHEDPVVDDRGADAGAEGREDDQALLALAPRRSAARRSPAASASLTTTTVVPEPSSQEPLGLEADPRRVDVGGRADHAVGHHARDRDADGGVAVDARRSGRRSGR